ncbi:hypothetical protein LSUB1_G004494 [Lachnellula subtilissima]|uniref:Uncharacterized protein n=1 Tax=Lachnellula subtilissima TaxID=602034 RepID=A0A8H8U7X0_9HELO|nr:hypothetical protein LSUB1_G004494 [Lachnellula subtilissima]
MQFLSTITALSLLALSTSALPTIQSTDGIAVRASPSAAKSNTTTASAVSPTLVPVFSIKTGSLKGLNGVAIPAVCPPSRADFIAKLNTNVAAGNVLGTPITFNTNAAVQDTNTNKNRATAMLITLQNFTGKKGVGCPAASTPELLTQQKTGVSGGDWDGMEWDAEFGGF